MWSLRLRNCALATSPFLRKSQNTVSIHPMVLEPLLFRRLKMLFFLPSRDWQYSNSQKLEPHSKSQYTVFTIEARVVQQTHSVFFCFTVVCVCHRKCVVGKLPCNAVAFEWALAQTDCHALATTHLCRLFFHVNVWLDGPWRRHSFKRRQHHEDAMAARRKRPKKRVFWTLPCGTIWQSFFCAQGCPKADKKNRKTQKVKAFSYGRTIQWAFKVRSSRPTGKSARTR